MSPEERAERIAQFAPHANYDFFMSNIVAAIREAVADEREACAAICDRWAAFQREEIGNYKSPVTRSKIEGREDASCKLAEIIRARSENASADDSTEAQPIPLVQSRPRKAR